MTSLAGPRSVVEYVSAGPPLSDVKNGPAMADDLGRSQRHLEGRRLFLDVVRHELIEQHVEVARVPRLDGQDRAGRADVGTAGDIRGSAEVRPDAGVLQGLRGLGERHEVGLGEVDEAGLGTGRAARVGDRLDQVGHVGVLVRLDRLEFLDVLAAGRGSASSSGCPLRAAVAARECRRGRGGRRGAAAQERAPPRLGRLVTRPAAPGRHPNPNESSFIAALRSGSIDQAPRG